MEVFKENQNNNNNTLAAPNQEVLEPTVFMQKLQMKLKSHLETSVSSDSSSSSEEYYTNSSSADSSNSEIFYDFDDVVEEEEIITSDYGTGSSNTVIGSRNSSSSSSSVVIESDSSTNISYRRSSSLKSGKTPPGTPMKKIVRFADAMGLDLTDIKVFLDEIPKIPKEAYRDLHIPDYCGSSETNKSVSQSTSNFVPLFHQPVTMPDFFDKIKDQKVLLENAYILYESERYVVKGTVRVMNLDFHKSVYVRYTYNNWAQFAEVQASYVADSCDGFSDRFEFAVDVSSLRDCAKLGFALRFHCQGTQFWDNNGSRNYVFENMSRRTTSYDSHGGGCSVYSPNSMISFYDHAYGNQFGSACFY